MIYSHPGTLFVYFWLNNRNILFFLILGEKVPIWRWPLFAHSLRRSLTSSSTLFFFGFLFSESFIIVHSFRRFLISLVLFLHTVAFFKPIIYTFWLWENILLMNKLVLISKWLNSMYFWGWGLVFNSILHLFLHINNSLMLISS